MCCSKTLRWIASAQFCFAPGLNLVTGSCLGQWASCMLGGTLHWPRWRCLATVLDEICRFANFCLPAGLRAAGATDDYLCFQNVGRLLRRGRWHQLRTLEHYLQSGTYILSGIRLPAMAELAITRYVAITQRFFRELVGDPAVPPPLDPRLSRFRTGGLERSGPLF